MRFIQRWLTSLLFLGMLGEFESTIPSAEKEVLLGDLFNQVHKPVIAKIEGDVYAGGFFFLAGSTYVVADTQVKLGLPEVKRGLYPFQVMAALLQVMPKRKVVDWCWSLIWRRLKISTKLLMD